MAVSEAEIKLLWGRAAGFCSRPGCRTDLTRLLDGGQSYNVGVMAHVIARSKGGPRARDDAGADTYANLVLLCPTCHRDIDKAPEGAFPEEMLQHWKAMHEARIRALGSELRYETAAALKAAVGLLLAENRVAWETLGPCSEIAQRDPSSNAHSLWTMRRLDKIVPNNRQIINVIRANVDLLTPEQAESFARFVNHAEAYEDHVYDRRDHYPTFPRVFEETFT